MCLAFKGMLLGTRKQWDPQLKTEEFLNGETAADLKMEVRLWDL